MALQTFKQSLELTSEVNLRLSGPECFLIFRERGGFERFIISESTPVRVHFQFLLQTETGEEWVNSGKLKRCYA